MEPITAFAVGKTLLPAALGFLCKQAFTVTSPGDPLQSFFGGIAEQFNSLAGNVSATYYTEIQKTLKEHRNQDTERLLADAWLAALNAAQSQVPAYLSPEQDAIFQLWQARLNAAKESDESLASLFWSGELNLAELRRNLQAGEPDWPADFEKLLRRWAEYQANYDKKPLPNLDPEFLIQLAAKLPALVEKATTHLLAIPAHEKAYKRYSIKLLESVPQLPQIKQALREVLREERVFSPPPNRFFNVDPPPTHFTGRKEVLEQIRKSLEASGAAALTALHGQGGIGKSSLAKQYAQTHRDQYQLVWWFNSANSTTLSNSYSQLAQTAQLPDAASYTAEQTLLAVQDWLHNKAPKPALLIFDNAPHPHDLQAHRQSYPATHMLITSRDPNWGSFAEPIELSLFTPDEARDFLLARCDASDKANAELLAQELGYLPLALDHAAAYIGNRRKSIAEYRQIFAEKAHRLVVEGYPETGYPHSLYQSFRLSFDALEEESPAAAQLLELFAFVAPDQFPRDVLASSATALPPPLDRICADGYDCDELLAAAHSYSLLNLSQENLSLHRLTQLALRHHLKRANTYDSTLLATIDLLNDSFPYEQNDPATWPLSRQQSPHAVAAIGYAKPLQPPASPDPGNTLNSLSRLANELGLLFLNLQGDLPQARALAELSLGLVEATFGPHHAKVATLASNLAAILQAEGELAGARALAERALVIAVATFDPNHPNVAIYASNLAQMLHAEGDLAGARTLTERAMAIDESALGPHHPNVAICANNLGQILQGQGDLAQARTLTARAMAIAEAAYGPNHTQVASYASNLGQILQGQGDLAQARTLTERALAIDQDALGTHHPKVATRANNLAAILQTQGDSEGARTLVERALAIYEAAFGPHHPDVAILANNLAQIFQAQGDLPQARTLTERALAIAQATFGPNNPTTKLYAANLAAITPDDPPSWPSET